MEVLTSKQGNARKLKAKLASLGLKASVKSPNAKSSHYFDIAPTKQNGYQFTNEQMTILNTFLRDAGAMDLWLKTIDFDADFVPVYSGQTSCVYLPAGTNLEIV